MRCLFCGRFCREPKGLDIRYLCKCGASYVACLEDDELETIMELHKKILGEDFMELPPDTELLELRRGRLYDVLLEYPSQPKEEGIPVIILFARKAE